MVAYWNVKGCEHGPLDFHASTKAFFNLQVLITEGLKSWRWVSEEEEVLIWKRRLEGEPMYEKMRVATLNMTFSFI